MESANKESCLKSVLVSVACISAVALSSSAAIGAQGRPELRADAIVTKSVAIYAGAGLLFPLGTYVRWGGVTGAGVVDGTAMYRLDLVTLFHSDPFRESKWGPYGGGGISFRSNTGDEDSNAFLMAFLGVEGPPKKGFAPAFELGLGGGARAGIILRRARERTR